MSDINILSIDFDYFQKVKKDTIYHYPDGIDLDTNTSNIVWASHYMNEITAAKIHEVTINKKKINFIKNVIKSNTDFDRNDCTTMITNSHVHIVELIKKLANKNDNITVYNVDMHHDMFGSKIKNGKIKTDGSLSCGNWAAHIKNEYTNSKIIWICNPISEKMYPSELPDLISYDLEIVEDIDFDGIFLCRSDNWSPPHLDDYFDDLRHTIQSNFYKTYIDSQITKKRDIQRYIDIISPHMQPMTDKK